MIKLLRNIGFGEADVPPAALTTGSANGDAGYSAAKLLCDKGLKPIGDIGEAEAGMGSANGDVRLRLVLFAYIVDGGGYGSTEGDIC